MRTLLLVTLAGALCAQTPQNPPPSAEEAPATIQVDVNVVNVLASVRDKRGGLVANLDRNDFAISEDGKPQDIKYFARETDLPLTIGLLIDVSGSQRNLLDIERSAAAQFFSQVLRKKDEAFLISFGEECELLQDYTGSARLLTRGMDGLRISSGVGGYGPGPVPTAGGPRGTVLYDAVFLAADEKLRTEVGRKVIVLITDGVDEGSQKTIDAAIEAAQKADAVIYSIDYSDPRAYGGFGPFGGFGGGAGEGYLRRMSDATGGHVYVVGRNHPLEEVFRELQEEMRSQYSIGYTSTNDKRDGTYRKLDVRLKDKNLKAQVRKGYYALKPDAR
ncbi:MAG: VWA domain-containing protein [Bryobacteraceae bacterium]